MMGKVVLPSVLLLLILLQPMRLVGVSSESKAVTCCLDACAVCSSANGCLSCLPGFFFLLQREGLRQRGHCLRRCPPGHFEKHRTERSVCARCRVPDCAQCFGVGSCTMCSPGYVLLQGSCLSTCPHGLQPDAHNVECTPIDAVTKRRGKKARRSGRNRCLKRRWEKSMGE